ncbi:ScyD/ScyE family protein [Rhodohalobacter mucosus]|uniref:ScyD/ScyE family protein n=1 Tax=Rhodohalobacter mucosus TaxID=2079485 RepID=A0A316TP15_9BACT|nr:ScyD/ScyE family protein [Rhodohalobacter mucosus]PWN05528.1 hypothetical protein DDZ15_13050 [Rhodohalobacter mucosus]
MILFNKPKKYSIKPLYIILAGVLIFSACNESTGIIDGKNAAEIAPGNSQASKSDLDATYEFDGPVFDISSLPNGGILVADFGTIKEIGKNGVREVTTLPLITGPGAGGAIESTFINGLEPIGNGNFFATRSGLDLALGAALFRATRNNTRLVADIENFTLGAWADGGEPGQAASWKSFACETPGGYTPGPQTNPYHLTALSGSDVLIADAAGNSLLHASTNGDIEVLATFGPVTEPATGDPIVQFPLEDGTPCYVEPVPTAVSVGADGAYYVGELNGAHPANFTGEATPDGLASVWRIEPGSRNVDCPSDKCEKVITGLNSVIDIEFGSDGYLYVVEYEQNGFLATVAPALGIPLAGGTVQKCDVSSGTCEIIEGEDGDLFLPGAITFDKWDNLWLLDNVFDPVVRRIALN